MGSYTNPHSPGDPNRPPILTMEVDHQHIDFTNRFHQDHLHQETLEWADVIIFMHMPNWVESQIEELKASGKHIVYRCIGQNHALVETQINNFRIQLGDKFHCVRYDKREKLWYGAVQEDVVIPFAKDIPKATWTYSSSNRDILLLTQAALRRGYFCHFNDFEVMTRGFNRLLVGTGNADAVNILPTSEPSYDELKTIFATSNLFMYSGTIPATYTLGVLEALAFGTPLLTISESWWRQESTQWIPEGMFSVDKWFPEQVIHSVAEGTETIKCLLDLPDVLRDMSTAQRAFFDLHFSYEAVTPLWKQFLESL